jgi:isopentenyl-diphosphate delta-isomerase type 1
MAATEQVILVDENDQIRGSAEKLQAHREGWCHRAFSIFIYRLHPKKEYLLQKRASTKYHSPNLWTNTCCSHPRPGEDIIAAGERRLQEELGLKLPLTKLGSFHYRVTFPNGLIENEVDHVLIGEYKGETLTPNPAEVDALQWLTLKDLQAALLKNPGDFTPWLPLVLPHVR